MAFGYIDPSISLASRGERAATWVSLAAITLWQAFPAPALAWANTLSQPGYFPQHIIFERSVPASFPFEAGTVLAVLATGYSSTVDQTDGDPFTTASGAQVREGTLASNFLPLGTAVRIGGRELVVEDRMNSRFNDTYRADIWFSSREEARDYGTRRELMEIVEVP